MINKSQRGVALIVAMLIVAIATIMATQIFYQQQISLRRTSNQLQAEKIYQLALGSEAWAKVMLKEDSKNEDVLKVHADYLGDVWAQPISLPDAEGAKIKIKITDAQSCFNINNLVLKGKTAQPEQIKMLQNLMTELKLNPQLVWTLVDWIDEDDQPNPEGAEIETYSRLIPAYRTANYRIIELSELYAVSGWNNETINALTPYICALQPAPKLNTKGRFFENSTEISKINVNTANEMVLRSLLPEMRNVNLSNVLEMRKTKPFKTVADFWQQFEKDNPSFWTQFSQDLKKNPGLVSPSKATLTLLLSVNSEYFLMEFSGSIDQLEQNYRSLIHRSSGAKTATTASATAAAQTKTPATTTETATDATSAAEATTTTEAPKATETQSAAELNSDGENTASATTPKNATPSTTTNANGTSATALPTAANNTAGNVQINTLYRLQYY